jgi:hypothetical protein
VSLAEVEAVGIRPLYARGQVWLHATGSPRLLGEPVEHPFAVTLQTSAPVGNEVIHVEMLAAVEILLDPELRHAPHAASVRPRRAGSPSNTGARP